jgi:hypothetical protein
MCGDLSRERWRWLDTQHQPKKKTMADYLKEKRRPKRLATMDQAFSNKHRSTKKEDGGLLERKTPTQTSRDYGPGLFKQMPSRMSCEYGTRTSRSKRNTVWNRPKPFQAYYCKEQAKAIPSVVAEKTFTHVFLATLWQTPHWIVLKRNTISHTKSTNDGFRFEKPRRSHTVQILHEAATRKRITKNTNDETDQLRGLQGPDWRKRGQIP